MAIPDAIGRLTGIIRTPNDALDKLWWNYQQYEVANDLRDGGQAQLFAFIDYTHASCAMLAWCCAEWPRDMVDRRSLCGPAMGAWLTATVPYSKELRHISNAAKHATDDQTHWLGGEHRLSTFMTADLRARIDRTNASGTINDFLREYLDGLATGEAWGESVLQTSGEDVAAGMAMAKNYQGWHDVVGELFS